MDKKLRGTTNLGVEIMNSKRQVLKEETWSSGTNLRLPFDVNLMLSSHEKILLFCSLIHWTKHWSGMKLLYINMFLDLIHAITMQ